MRLIVGVVAAAQLGQTLRKQDNSRVNGAQKDRLATTPERTRQLLEVLAGFNPVLDCLSPHYPAQFRCSQLQGATPRTAPPRTPLPHPHFWR